MRKRRLVVHALIVTSAASLLFACGTSARRTGEEISSAGIAAPEVEKEPAAATAEKRVEELLDAAGLGAEILENAETTLVLYDVIVRILPPHAEASRHLAAERIDEVATAELLLEPARAHFLEHLDATKVDSVLLWLDTEPGRKWSLAVRGGLGGPEEDDAAVSGWLRGFYGSLEEDPDKQARVELLRRIEESSAHAQRSMELMPALGEQLLDAFSSRLPEPIAPMEEHVAAVRESLRSAMRRPGVEAAVFDSYLYATRELDLEELEVVASFFEDGPGAWLLDVLDGANRKAGEAYAGALAANLADAWAALSESDEEPSDQPDSPDDRRPPEG